jgi:hypothetical protein
MSSDNLPDSCNLKPLFTEKSLLLPTVKPLISDPLLLISLPNIDSVVKGEPTVLIILIESGIFHQTW